MANFSCDLRISKNSSSIHKFCIQFYQHVTVGVNQSEFGCMRYTQGIVKEVKWSSKKLAVPRWLHVSFQLYSVRKLFTLSACSEEALALRCPGTALSLCQLNPMYFHEIFCSSTEENQVSWSLTRIEQRPVGLPFFYQFCAESILKCLRMKPSSQGKFELFLCVCSSNPLCDDENNLG